MYSRSLRRESSKLGLGKKRIGMGVNEILFLFVESGLMYCLSSVSTFFVFFLGDVRLNAPQIVLIVGRFIPLPGYSFATYYQPIHIQISAIYPALLLVMINQKRAMFWNASQRPIQKPEDLSLELDAFEDISQASTTVVHSPLVLRSARVRGS